MARQLRIHEAGLIYHVHARGNGKMAIYADDEDRVDFLSILADTVDSHALVCHAYCLMTTHYHLVLTTVRANLSTAIQQLNSRYAQHWNRRHGHVGHVFQGRFGAQIVQDEAYFLTVCRYVLANPVRATMVAAAEDWPWSSLAATLGTAHHPPFLDTRVLLSHFASSSPARSAAAFGRFVRASPADADVPRDRRVLGDEQFVARFAERARQADREVPRVERMLHLSLEDLFRHAHTRALRNTCVVRAYAAGFSLAEIARLLGVHPGTVSKIIRSDRESRHGVRSSEKCGGKM